MKIYPFIKIASFSLIVVLASTLIGCTLMGTSIIRTDRSKYSVEVIKSESNQLLRNIVRLRYLDLIGFLQINSITAQKTLQNSATGIITIPSTPSHSSYTGPTVQYTDAPTVSFTPLQGSEFVSHLLTVTSFRSIEYLCNTHWDIKTILLLSLERINDQYNEVGFESRVGNSTAHNYHTFLKIVDYLDILQRNAAIGLRVEIRSKEEYLVIIFNHKRAREIELKLKRLLHIAPDADYMAFSQTYGTSSINNVVSVKTRSIVGMLAYLANAVHIPPQNNRIANIPTPRIPIMNIYSSEKPVAAMFSTYYRGYYYYIDDNDLKSKLTFLILSDFYQLSAGLPGGNNGVVLTLPVGK